MLSSINEPQVVIVHGAGGALGSAVARAFVRRGARLFLTGIRDESLGRTCHSISSEGGPVETHALDAFDESAVDEHARHVAETAGRIDFVFNGVGIPLTQGTPLLSMATNDVVAPLEWVRTQFVTARAAGRAMATRGAGTILTLSASPARVAIGGVGGFAAACAAVEGLTRTFAAELGPMGVRVVGLRLQRVRDTLRGIPDLPMDPKEFESFLESLTTSKNLPTLEEVGNAAVFLAESGANVMNGSIMNLTCGMSPD